MSSDTPPVDRKAFNERRKALIDAGVSQSDIARQAEPPVCNALVHQVLLGRRKSPRVFAVLTAKLGREIVEKLWPECENPRQAGGSPGALPRGSQSPLT